VSNRECVLVVDRVPDTALVLEAALAPRGLTVNRIRRLDPALPPAVANRPTVIVVDLESCEPLSNSPCEDWQNVPQVIIGTMHAGETANDAPRRCGAPQRRYLQKPFQFSELIEAIEALIAGNRRHVFPSDR
jgi:DNA-binding response OmpR family regulator